MTARRHRQTDKQTHTTQDNHTHVRTQKETGSYGMSQQQNTKNDIHGMVSTELTGCSKRTHPANTVGDSAPL